MDTNTPESITRLHKSQILAAYHLESRILVATEQIFSGIKYTPDQKLKIFSDTFYRLIKQGGIKPRSTYVFCDQLTDTDKRVLEQYKKYESDNKPESFVKSVIDFRVAKRNAEFYTKYLHKQKSM